MPTATWKSRLRSGSAHCDLQLAVEVRQLPLGSGARGGGPAVPTGIWTARRRRRVRRRRRQRRRRRRRRRTALIKSNNPHLAGGEKHPAGSKTVLMKIEFYKKNVCFATARHPFVSPEKWQIWTSKFGCFLGTLWFRYSKAQFSCLFRSGKFRHLFHSIFRSISAVF